MGFPGLRYANLFWSMPERDVFAAVGFHRQLIIVLPKLDVVAVFTGAMRFAYAAGVPGAPGYRLGDAIDWLDKAVKTEASLPEDSPSLSLLADKTKDMTVDAPTQATRASATL